MTPEQARRLRQGLLLVLGVVDELAGPERARPVEMPRPRRRCRPPMPDRPASDIEVQRAKERLR